MKKILLSFALLGLLVGLIVPMLVSAQDAPTGCTIRRDVNSVITGATCVAVGSDQDFDSDAGTINGAMCCFFSTLLYVTDLIFMVLMILVVILILVGAFNIMTAGGSEEGIKKGRNYIVYALIGVVVALLARALPYIMRSIMGI